MHKANLCPFPNIHYAQDTMLASEKHSKRGSMASENQKTDQIKTALPVVKMQYK